MLLIRVLVIHALAEMEDLQEKYQNAKTCRKKKKSNFIIQKRKRFLLATFKRKKKGRANI